MNQIRKNNDESDLEGFQTPESDFDTPLDGATQDDTDFQDLGDDMNTDVFGEEPPPEKPAKKGVNWFNIIVAVVAIAGAGGLIWSKLGPQLMSSGGGGAIEVVSTPASGLDTGTMVANSEAAVQAAVQAVSESPSGAGLLDNPDGFAQMNAAPAPVRAAEPQAEIDPFASLGMAAPAPAPVVEAVPVNTEAQALAVAQAPVQGAPVQAVPLAPALVAVPSEDTVALKMQVQALEQKFAALDGKITMAVEKIAAMPVAVAAPVDDARLSNIQSALERLEARMDTMARAPKAAPMQVSTDEAPRKKVKKPVIVTPKKVKAAPSKMDAPYSPPQKIEVSAGGSTAWALRGARDGRAVIARGDDLREVSVGETVPGLGEITGVANLNGKWVVQGTQGRLSY